MRIYLHIAVRQNIWCTLRNKVVPLPIPSIFTNTITEVLFRTSVVQDKKRCTKGALKHAEYIMATLISTGILQSWCAGHEFFMVTVQSWPAVNWWRSNTAKISLIKFTLQTDTSTEWNCFLVSTLLGSCSQAERSVRPRFDPSLQVQAMHTISASKHFFTKAVSNVVCRMHNYLSSLAKAVTNAVCHMHNDLSSSAKGPKLSLMLYVACITTLVLWPKLSLMLYVACILT